MLVVTACLQGTLLTMAIYFEYFGPKNKGKIGRGENQAPNGDGALGATPAPEEQGQSEQPGEETPLLQSS